MQSLIISAKRAGKNSSKWVRGGVFCVIASLLLLSGCISLRPTITASDSADFRVSPTINKDVVRFSVWDKEGYCLWRVTGRLKTGLLGADIDYGKVPNTMKQKFPVSETYEALPIKHPADGKEVYFQIDFIDDHFFAPGRGDRTAVFVKKAGMFHYLRELSRTERHKLWRATRATGKWKNYAEIAAARKALMDEIVAEDPPFLRIAETDEASAAEETVY